MKKKKKKTTQILKKFVKIKTLILGFLFALIFLKKNFFKKYFLFGISFKKFHQ